MIPPGSPGGRAMARCTKQGDDALAPPPSAPCRGTARIVGPATPCRPPQVVGPPAELYWKVPTNQSATEGTPHERYIAVPGDQNHNRSYSVLRCRDYPAGLSEP